LFIETIDSLYYSYEYDLCFLWLCSFKYNSPPNGILFLICHYITIKTKECNNKIRHYIKNRIALNNKRANNLMTELNSICLEIEDRNQNYWSKYLFWVWILFATIINMFLYLAIFSKGNFLLRFICIMGPLFLF
jgi:hypothetical protein